MRNWLGEHRDTFARVALRLARSPIGTLFNALVIGIAIAVPLGLYLALQTTRAHVAQLPAAPEVSIFLVPDATHSDAARIEARLAEEPGVQSHRFVGKDEALARMRAAGALAGVLEGLAANPLPDAFVVRLADPAPDRLASLRDRAAKWPRVDQVQVDSAWAQRLAAMLQVGRLAAAVLAGLLGLGLLVITFNTIRLQIVTQREEIEVARLIGATRAFVRRPFLYAGALQGLLGGLAGLGLAAVSVAVLNTGLVEVGRSYGLDFALEYARWADSAAIVGFSTGLGWLGAWLSTGQHLDTRASS